MTRKQEIAQTILEQLSGRRFLVMTGAKNLLALESGLQMQIPGRGSKKVVRIVLNGLDLYDLEFGTLRSTNYRVDRRFDDVYAEQLQDLFTEATGFLYPPVNRKFENRLIFWISICLNRRRKRIRYRHLFRLNPPFSGV